jgi:hypothetical protein
VAPTASDVRDVLVEGESGLLAIPPSWSRPRYKRSKRRLTWPNVAIATTYSADEPERLRGPQHDPALCDEIAVWRYPIAFDMLMPGLRLGKNPRVAVMTTPRPTLLLRTLLESKTMTTTYENRAQPATEFVERIISKYEGTRLGRQELLGELLESLDGAWFGAFDPAKHVNTSAEYWSGLPVRLAIDAGTSRHCGAVFSQVQELGACRHRVTVFGDYDRVDQFRETDALAIRDVAAKLCGGRADVVQLDPASSARTGVGPAAYAELERVFGSRITSYLPTHRVLDGLDTIELLLGSESREPDLIIHPRCKDLIQAISSYVRAQRGGEWLSFRLIPSTPPRTSWMPSAGAFATRSRRDAGPAPVS